MYCEMVLTLKELSRLERNVDATRRPSRRLQRLASIRRHATGSQRRHLPSWTCASHCHQGGQTRAKYYDYNTIAIEVSTENILFQGIVDMRFDTQFIFSEVNADRVNWKLVDGEYCMTTVQHGNIGLKISTHKPRLMERVLNQYAPSSEIHRLDLTSQYKYPDGTTAFSVLGLRVWERQV